MLFAFTVCGAAALHAQPAASDEPRGYAEVNLGATFGHKSDMSVGAEGGWAVMRDLDVFFEFGHIGNAASSDLESRANGIANNVGATANVIAKVNYFDAGVRYRFIINQPNVRPYVAAGFGGAHVTTQTTFSVNGTEVPPENLGIALGPDLSGSETVPFFMLGGGATVTFHTRYFVDVSYRYGRVFEKKDDDGNVQLAAFNTNRLQVGVGLTF
jgi:opacity protein-like surface antigen